MFRSIMIPLDGSALGEQAMPLALSIARRSDAAMQVVQVHTYFVHVESGMMYDDQLDRLLREQETSYLKDVVKRLSAVAPNRTTWAFREGAAADQLLVQIKESGSDLVVMSTHGHSALTRFWLGSVANELVRRSSCPVLLVRPRDTRPDLGQEPILRHVFVPLDGSTVSEEILDHAVPLSQLLNADLTLFRVVKPLLFPGHDPTQLKDLPFGQPAAEQMQREARNYLDAMAERLRAQSLSVQTRVVVHRQPAVAILQHAIEQPDTLIALATHGRGGLTRMLLGSVADKVIRGATTPVLVSRPSRQ
jgi:nucleotide-binding universal stress UspA family protein